MRAKPPVIQLGIFKTPVATAIEVTLEVLESPEEIQAAWPDREFIESIARDGVQVPISVCPIGDGRFHTYDGRRRVLALWSLSLAGLDLDGVPIADIPIPAMLRNDLTPKTAIVQSFQTNNLRSGNPVTDIEAIRRVINEYNFDPNTKEGRKSIATILGVDTRRVATLAKKVLFPEALIEAVRDGHLTEAAYDLVIQYDDDKIVSRVIQRLVQGEVVSARDVAGLRKVVRDKANRDAQNGRSFDFGFQQEGSPLQDAIDLLEKHKKIKAVAEAIQLLKTLL